MAEFLIEIVSGEIPASMQSNALEKFTELLMRHLADFGVKNMLKTWVTPRRIGAALDLADFNVSSEKVRGPKVVAPQVALDGFMSKYALTQDALQVEGDYYFAEISNKNSDAKSYIESTLPKVLKEMPWAKSMFWNDSKAEWIRPIHYILAFYNGAPLHFSYGGISAGIKTHSHRFMGHEIELQDLSLTGYTYAVGRTVLLTQQERRDSILAQIATLNAPADLIMDESLLDEIVGLVEKPFVFLAKFDERYLKLPKEVLRLTLKLHQKYLMMQNKDGSISQYFIIVSNTMPTDSGAAIIEGNLKVTHARLSDAEFFYHEDLRTNLDAMYEKLDSLIFHQSYGSYFKKQQSVLSVAEHLNRHFQFDMEKMAQVIKYAKVDLLSKTVGELPELQGTIGMYLLLAHGADADVALAVSEHYKPNGASDELPSSYLGSIAALAEKIDTLQTLFALGIKPSGSKDPYGLRRAAIGINRILTALNTQVSMQDLFTNKEALAFAESKI